MRDGGSVVLRCIGMAVALIAGTALPSSVAAQADWERSALPLRFATISPEVQQQLATDWRELAPLAKEWAYCVVGWSPALTSEGDSIFIATEIRRRDVRQSTGSTAQFDDCVDVDGERLPSIHAHLSGNCSPSRTDIHQALQRMAPFELLVCGPGAYSGYFAGLYLLAMEGKSSSDARTRARSP